MLRTCANDLVEQRGLDALRVRSSSGSKTRGVPRRAGESATTAPDERRFLADRTKSTGSSASGNASQRRSTRIEPIR
jgi:hypothetical protein